MVVHSPFDDKSNIKTLGACLRISEQIKTVRCTQTCRSSKKIPISGIKTMHSDPFIIRIFQVEVI